MSFKLSVYSLNNRKMLSEYQKNMMADKTILNREVQEIKSSSINGEMRSGRYKIDMGGGIFEVLFCRNMNKTKKRLFVFLSGGREPSNEGFKDKLPRFKRWSFYKYLDGDTLVIDDPMYRDWPNLQIGWFYGSENHSYGIDVVNLVKLWAKNLSISSERDICFYGSSSGGYAAVYCAACFKNANCVAINPQLMLNNDSYKSTFESIVKIKFSNDDIYNRNKLLTLMDDYYGKMLIVQNIQDFSHCKNHFVPFCRGYGFNPKFGITSYNRVITYVYNADGGHVAYENKYMVSMLLKLIYDDISIDDIYINFSFIWGLCKNKS